MTKILSANLMRLKRDKTFWLSVLVMFALGVAFPIIKYAGQRNFVKAALEAGFFAIDIVLAILMAAFCSLFVGTEYSDGTIRNKIAAGLDRSAIYLSHLITCVAVSFVLYTVYAIPHLCLGAPLLGFFIMGAEKAALFFVTMFALAAAFTAIFHLIAMLNQNKAAGVVQCLLLALLLLLAGAVLFGMLNQPKTYREMVMSADGEEWLMEDEDEGVPVMRDVPNPFYLDGEVRRAVQFLCDVLPGGQAMQCADGMVINLRRLPVYSLVVTCLTAGIGLACFKKKDLR